MRAAPEIEGVPALYPSGAQRQAQLSRVDEDFFAAMNARVTTGRTFNAADVSSAAPVVVVNESFVRVVLDGLNPLGRRLRFTYTVRSADGSSAEQTGPWLEIIGVVNDIAMWVDPDLPDQAGIYQPLSVQDAGELQLAVRLDGDRNAFAPRLRALAAAVDAELRLEEVAPLEDIAGAYLSAITFWFRALMSAGAVALVLSLAGIYSIMAFTVARRTREIGIRVALGSGRGRVIFALFQRAFFQVGTGVALGLSVIVLFALRAADVPDAFGWMSNIGLIALYAVLMAGVCLLACVVPARRALRVQPTEALNADA